MNRQGHVRSGRYPVSTKHNAPTVRQSAQPAVGRRQGLRARGGGQTNDRQPFMPNEKWYEPRETGDGYRVITQSPGVGYRHVVTPDEIRARLAALPAELVRPLEVVQLCQMTRKKRGAPIYGMQWGAAVYLYPIEVGLTETYDVPPRPARMNEARMYGGRWEQRGPKCWALVWTEQAIKDFYLNNILIHELGHVVDRRNSRSVDRERFAEWFAVEYGYRPTQATRRSMRNQPVIR